jgi:hypothetical protein
VQADPAKWPSTLVFKTTAGGCTATMVGQRAVLTAAHCVTDGASGKITLAQGDVQVKCTHHPNYLTDYSADFALCVSGGKLPDVTNGFERIGATVPKSGDQIQIIGYGCLTEGGGDRTFGELWAGFATVDSFPPDLGYFVTKGAAVCFGDSGGAAYVVNGGHRAIVGVNSRGDISKYSWISITRGKGFIDWAKEWSTTNNAPICGIASNAGKCRQE